MLRLLVCLLLLANAPDAFQRSRAGGAKPGAGAPPAGAGQRAGGKRAGGKRAGGPGAKGPAAGRGAAKGPSSGGVLPPLLYPPSAAGAPKGQPAAAAPARASSAAALPDTPLGDLPELADLQTEYFAIADHDGNSWISYREAVASMDVDRGEFRSFDADRDGRIDSAEFGARLRQTVELVGSFRPPRPRPEAADRTPDISATLLDSVDLDNDGSLGVFELQAAFEALNASSNLDAQLVLSSFDRDLSGTLDAEEFSDIARSLREGTFAIAPAPAEPPTSIDELFGVPVPRRTLPGAGASTLPPRLVGPVTHFHRLDADRDGSISPEDLLQLQAPLHLEVRARAVVAFLDLDGDGTLNRAELRAAFE